MFNEKLLLTLQSFDPGERRGSKYDLLSHGYSLWGRYKDKEGFSVARLD